MRRRHTIPWLILCCGLLAGCSGFPLHRGDSGRPERSTAPTIGETRTGNDTITPLLRDAADAESSGDTERAAALLERAIRVAPEDPLPWSRLAGLRVREGRGSQAEQLAVKSNRLAGEDRALKAHNWRLIAESRRLVGDDAGARSAEEKTKPLEER